MMICAYISLSLNTDLRAPHRCRAASLEAARRNPQATSFPGPSRAQDLIGNTVCNQPQEAFPRRIFAPFARDGATLRARDKRIVCWLPRRNDAKLFDALHQDVAGTASSRTTSGHAGALRHALTSSALTAEMGGVLRAASADRRLTRALSDLASHQLPPRKPRSAGQVMQPRLDALLARMCTTAVEALTMTPPADDAALLSLAAPLLFVPSSAPP